MKSLTKLFILTLTFIPIFFAGCEGSDDDPDNTVKDIEGNVYKTVKIGSQVWMAENLKTITFDDGTDIPNVQNSAEWETQTASAYCLYNNDADSKEKYGAMYNWHAVKSGKLCPAGWHVPSDSDFIKLETSLGLPQNEVHIYGWRGTDQGAQMKSTSGWIGGEGFATNSSEMSVVSAGYRQRKLGLFSGVGTITILWTSSDDSFNGKPNEAWYRRFDATESRVFKGTSLKAAGSYVRCVKN